MEVIEINSEDVSFQEQRSKKDDIIVYVSNDIRFTMLFTNHRLSDDSDPIIYTNNSTLGKPLPPSSPRGPDFELDKPLEPASLKESGSILDIENWLSSSDDDSMEFLSMPAPKKPLRNKKQLDASTFEKVNSPEFKIKLPLKVAESALPPITIETDLSDPISSSPKSSQVFTKTASQLPFSASEPRTQSSQAFSKKEWNEVNKVTRKKEDIFKEMILEIPKCLQKMFETEYFKNVFEGTLHYQNSATIPLISWKRKVKAVYNSQDDIFEPCHPKEISERFSVLYYEAEDLVEKIRNDKLQEDYEHAIRLLQDANSRLDNHVMIMVIGLREYIRKLQGIEDRVYRVEMSKKMNEQVSKKRKHEEVRIKASDAQRCIQKAGVDLGVNIFSVRTTHEAIDWLHSFTYTIGSSLYDKFQRNPSLANIGTVRLGSDKKSTFIEMLKKFNLMTQPRAEKLYEFYTSPIAIYRKYLENETLGTVNGKNILPPTSNAAMRRTFTATDPSQIIT